MKTSIIIPTYNNLSILKRCIDSIVQNTILTECEIIIISNGCVDGTKEYVESLDKNIFKLFYWDKPLGYTRAVNIGISLTDSDFVVLMNNDCQILDWGKDWWLPSLLEPFSDEKVAMTGIVQSWRGGKDGTPLRPWFMFALAVLRRDVVLKAGLLDESFSPGGGEDTEYCLRLQDMGYKLQRVPKDAEGYDIPFPIYHQGHVTMQHIDNHDQVYARNCKILEDRYGFDLA